MSNVKTLFIVDSAVKDTEEVIKNLPKGSEVIVLNEQADGVQQIVEITSNILKEVTLNGQCGTHTLRFGWIFKCQEAPSLGGISIPTSCSSTKFLL